VRVTLPVNTEYQRLDKLKLVEQLGRTQYSFGDFLFQQHIV
jgi:hypothetical protein